MEHSYRNALRMISRGVVLFLRCWSSTLNRLLRDLLHGISKHWFFAALLVASFVMMFMTMADSRAQYHHTQMVNYQLSQSLDSIKILIEK